MENISKIGMVALLLTLPLALMIACNSTSKKIPPDLSESKKEAQAANPVVLRARATLKPVKENFMKALTAMMAQGTEEAISACRVMAPALNQSASKEGVEVGRTSHLLRNPENAPREWVKPFLEEFQKAPKIEEAFRMISLSNGRIGYVEPIYVKPLCLHCHGGAISDSVSAKIKTLYPSDKATGFQEGDFRGLFWVEMDKN